MSSDASRHLNCNLSRLAYTKTTEAGLSSYTRRLHVSSANPSPRKPVIIPKRNSASATNSPNFSKKPTGRLGPPSSGTDAVFADGLFEFAPCDQCSKLYSHSLDVWMDHLGEIHPIPLCWPSSRAEQLDEAEQRHPYTSVVGSNKKRKADAVPRPLNSFMVSLINSTWVRTNF